MNDDAQLLSRFASKGDEAAFSELVRRHLNLVYSVALRLLGGDAHLAQDVTQTVFTDLARKAKSLPRDAVLSGWFHTATRFAAANAVRTERRRQAREQEAMAMHASTPESTSDWDQLHPVLDAAIGELSTTDRDAVLLRFFERKDFNAVGAALGVSEDAAQKRVARALEKLRTILTQRGVNLPATALAAAISGGAVQTAPAGLVVAVSAASLAGAATAVTSSLLELMATTKFKIATAAIIAASIAAPLIVQQRANQALRRENLALREQTGQLAELEQLRAENQRLAKLRVDAEELEQLRKNQSELIRLRGEVGGLRRRLGVAVMPATERATETKTAQHEGIGEIIPMEKWKDAGQTSPEATVQSIWWAAAQRDAERVRRCLVFLSGTNAVPLEYAAVHLQDMVVRLNNGQMAAVRIDSVSDTVSTDSVDVRVQGLRRKTLRNDQIDQSSWEETVPEEHRLWKVDGAWRIIVATPPPGVFGTPIGDPEVAAKIWSRIPQEVMDRFKPALSPEALRMIQELQLKDQK